VKSPALTRKTRVPKGFSLLEVLIAIILAAVVLTATISLQANISKLAAIDSLRMAALPIAEEKMEEMARTHFAGREESIRGQFRLIAQTDVLREKFPVSRLRLEVYYGSQKVLEVCSYRAP